MIKWVGSVSEDAITHVTCPKCGAAPGKRCVTPQYKLTSVHGQRCTEVKKLAESLNADPWTIQASPIEEAMAQDLAICFNATVKIDPSGEVPPEVAFFDTTSVLGVNNFFLKKDKMITYEELKEHFQHLGSEWFIHRRGDGHIFVPNQAAEFDESFQKSILHFKDDTLKALVLLKNLGPHFLDLMDQRVKELEEENQVLQSKLEERNYEALVNLVEHFANGVEVYLGAETDFRREQLANLAVTARSLLAKA